MFAASILITMRRKMLCSAYKTPWMRLFDKTCKINYMRLKSVFALSLKYISYCDDFILSIGLINPDWLITIAV